MKMYGVDMGTQQFNYKKIIAVIIMLVMLCYRGVVASDICLEGDFDSQLRHLLTTQLMEHGDAGNLSNVFVDLQDTLQTRWPGSVVTPLGSAATGMTMKSSDADCVVKVPYYNIYNETANLYLIRETVKLLEQQPELYTKVLAKIRAHNQIHLLKFYYVPTERLCDVNFIESFGVAIGELLGSYYSLDNKAWTLAFIIKFWAKVHRTKTSGMLTSYSLNLLIIFYLQQLKMLPPYYLLQSALSQRSLINKKSIHKPTDDLMSMYQLLGGFFKYYNEFNSEEYVVSVTAGRPVHKREFEDFENLPEIFAAFKEHRLQQPDFKPFSSDTPLCVQDALDQHLNVLDNVPEHVAPFISQVKRAAELFETLPRERFLSAILQRNEFDVELEPSPFIDVVKDLDNCLNKT